MVIRILNTFSLLGSCTKDNEQRFPCSKWTELGKGEELSEREAMFISVQPGPDAVQETAIC